MKPGFLQDLSVFAMVSLVFCIACAAHADDPESMRLEIRTLKERIDQLESRLKVFEQRQSNQVSSVDSGITNGILLPLEQPKPTSGMNAKGPSLPQISIGSEGFQMRASDGSSTLSLHGLIQADSRTYFHDAGIVGNDTLLLRRVRPILQGTLYRAADFLFVPDFAPSTGPQILDAVINYNFSPEVQLMAGKFKGPVGLEFLQYDQFSFFNERSLATYFVPGRDVGFELHGDAAGGVLSYGLGIFNGVGDGRNSSNVDFEDDKEFAGRLFVQPFKPWTNSWSEGIGVGVGGSFESIQAATATALPQSTGGTLPGYNSEGQQQFFAYNPAGATVVAAGDHWRLSPQGWYFHGPFSFFGEYVISNQELARSATTNAGPRVDLNNTAWEVTAGWMITGESHGFNTAVVPAHPFHPLGNGWGAWELVARYSEANIDRGAFPRFSDPTSSAHTADAWSFGLNWYLNSNVSLRASFTHTLFLGGGEGTTAPGIVTRKDENVLFTRLQLWF